VTAYTLSTNTNIDALTAKAGDDTYATNGFTLTVDQDSRTGLNQTTSTTLGAMTVTATLGGNINIDGRDVWMIPYTGGSGNVPAWNTAITRGTGTGKLIGVHASLTAASTATGAAMPATGFIRVKQKSGAYTAGALTGITATASDVGRIGWLEVVGNEAGTINANRLGAVNITGAWYAVGATSGVSNQTMQIPNNGLLRYAAGVYIEKTAGLQDFEFYPNAGTVTTIGTDATRGKVCWIDANGLVRLGNSGAATNGYTPVAGLAVVIGNVFLENCTTAARTANVIPNATIATRYDFTTTGGGVVVMDKVNCAWYGSFSQAYSVTVTNTGFVDAVLFNEIATPMINSKIGVGNKPTTALLVSPLILTLSFAGGTFTDCVWGRVSHAASGAYTNTVTDIANFEFIDDTARANTIRANATTGSWIATRAVNCKWTRPKLIQGKMLFIQSAFSDVIDPTYVDCVSGTTVTTYAMYVVELSATTINMKLKGMILPVTNCQPYTALYSIAGAGCANIKIRNIATRVAPLNLGTVNATGLTYVIGAGAAAADVKVQDVWTVNNRIGIMTGDNSSTRITEEKVSGDYADVTDVMACLNMTRKGMGGTGALTAQTAVYGTHWLDGFTSTTAGRITILMNEPSSLTTSQVTLSNGAAFTSAGGLYMPVIGHQAVFEMPDYTIGHTAFANAVGVMAGGTIGNYLIEFSIDKNDGSGFSAYQTATGANLSGVTGINAQLGFKLRVRVTTSTTNATAITSLYFTTVSTTTAQDYLYPLDVATVEIGGLVTDSRVVAKKVSDGTVLFNGVEVAGSVLFTTDFIGAVRIIARKASAAPYYIEWETQITTIAGSMVSAIALQQSE
jgi:hypothetical protein